ncbi:ComEC family competence protein [Mucilaginibacter sp. UR6-1]|uniref:ComEC/Rec2 family competence protein n=1 Tax=Mucilaginibacter sp. UR6-1 TaxID=1435643 RepID=UPI001E3E554D|nr:ComEC/Rec2 family competence protein [Mucilaginibacter sp. UR6-1]MCC8407886.1 ComEC family competence protein [Mucilaginibacter sp. UR6-1]
MRASHKDAFPFVVLLAPFAAGILLRVYNPDLLNSFPLWSLLVLATLFVLLNLLHKPLKIFRHTWLGGIVAIVFLFTAGIVITGNAIEINNPKHFSKINASNLLVTVINEPVSKNDNMRFTAGVTNAISSGKLLNVNGKILITLSKKAVKRISYGDVLLIPVNYKPVDLPLNPAEFNYRRYLAHKNIYHQAYISPAHFSIVETDAGNPLMAYAQNLRKRLVNKFKIVITDADASAVASTLILGYSAELSNDVLQAYSKTGTIHILSVSGAHVGLIYLVLVFILAPLNKGTRGKIFVTLIVIACIWGYALLTGFSPPVCRAGIMLSFILLGRCFARRISQLNILAVSAFITLLADPLLITDVGFQLSYIAVAGLIILQPIIYQKFTFNNKLADKIWLVSSASIAAQLVTLPLSTYYFHQVPVYFLVSNLVILIPSALIMYGGILYLLIPQGWLPGKWLGLLVEKLILFTNRTLSIIEHAPWSAINRVWLNSIEFLLAVVIVLLISYWLNKPKKTLIIALCAMIVTLTTFRMWNNYHIVHNKQIVFFSLRNNAAIGLRSGNNLILITDVDTGSKTYSYSIKPYIDSCEIDKINIIGFKSAINANKITGKNKLVNFANKRMIIIDANDNLSINKKYDYLYLKGKIELDNDQLNKITKHQTVIIAGKSTGFYRQQLIGRLERKHIKYMVSGSNKAMLTPSNR